MPRNLKIRQCDIDRVMRLLTKGVHTHREIEAITGVSRATVGALARGERKPIGCSDTKQKALNRKYFGVGPADYVRCPKCGANVLLPCVACEAREYAASIKKPN